MKVSTITNRATPLALLIETFTLTFSKSVKTSLDKKQEDCSLLASKNTSVIYA
jgi:hypothetical protein